MNAEEKETQRLTSPEHKSVAEKVIERLKDLEAAEWITVHHPGQEIDIDRINARLKARGYSIQLNRKHEQNRFP